MVIVRLKNRRDWKKTFYIIMFFICIIKIYPRWSYKEYAKRCEINAQHSNFIPKSAIKHVKFKIDKDSIMDIICGIGIIVFGILIMYSIIITN